MRSIALHGPTGRSARRAFFALSASHILARVQGGVYGQRVSFGCRVAGATRRSAAHGEVPPADLQPLDSSRTRFSGVPPETFDAHRTCPAVSCCRPSAAEAP